MSQYPKQTQGTLEAIINAHPQSEEYHEVTILIRSVLTILTWNNAAYQNAVDCIEMFQDCCAEQIDITGFCRNPLLCSSPLCQHHERVFRHTGCQNLHEVGKYDHTSKAGIHHYSHHDCPRGHRSQREKDWPPVQGRGEWGHQDGKNWHGGRWKMEIRGMNRCITYKPYTDKSDPRFWAQCFLFQQLGSWICVLLGMLHQICYIHGIQHPFCLLDLWWLKKQYQCGV